MRWIALIVLALVCGCKSATRIVLEYKPKAMEGATLRIEMKPQL